MREPNRRRKTNAISSEVGRFERGRGGGRKFRLNDFDFPIAGGNPGNSFMFFDKFLSSFYI